MSPHLNYEDYKKSTRLRPDKYSYWFRFKELYPGAYICCNDVIDLDTHLKLVDVGLYHADASKSTAYYMILGKSVIERLSEPPSLRWEA